MNQKMNKTGKATDMSTKIDDILAEVVDGSLGGAASVPGVVAIAADSSGVIYEGAAGERRLGSGEAMQMDQVLWSRQGRDHFAQSAHPHVRLRL